MAADEPAGVSQFFGDDEDDRSASGAPTATTSGKPSLSGVYTLLAQTKPDDDITLPSRGLSEDDTVSLPRAVIATELFSGLTTAIENKKRDARQIDDLTAPMVHLKEVARVLDKAAIAYANVKNRPGFSSADFAAAIQEYERAAAAFRSVASPNEEPGD